MISKFTLQASGHLSMEEYYSNVAINHVEGKVTLARTQFKAMSKAQRKEFISFLISEWQASAGNAMYDFFFNLL